MTLDQDIILAVVELILLNNRGLFSLKQDDYLYGCVLYLSIHFNSFNFHLFHLKFHSLNFQSIKLSFISFDSINFFFPTSFSPIFPAALMFLNKKLTTILQVNKSEQYIIVKQFYSMQETSFYRVSSFLKMLNKRRDNGGLPDALSRLINNRLFIWKTTIEELLHILQSTL